MAGRTPRSFGFFIIALLTWLWTAPVAVAFSLIRDADIEHGLRQLAQPIIAAAGLNPSRIKVLLVNDSKLNAFVVDTNHIMLHTGLVLKVKNAEELQAVIAHEVAHIANGHLTRRLSNIRNAQGVAAFGLVLGGLVAGISGNAEAGAGLALGTNSAATRNFLAHSRAEESSADQSALRYMATAGIRPQAMSDVLEYFRGQEVLSAARQDPYVRGHPLTRDRIRAVAGYAAAYADRTRENPEAQYWFARVKGKLGAFLQAPNYTLRRIDRSDTSDLALMRRAIALHRIPKRDEAIAAIGTLASRRPNDPFIHELRGQILLESRQFAQAVQAYGRAVELAGSEPLILAGLGRALLALNTTEGNRRALATLERARARDPRDPRMMRDLAVAYAKAGNNGMASLATAERYALLGRIADAGIHAKRAVDLLPRGSSGWNRAQDVLRAAENAANGSNE